MRTKSWKTLANRLEARPDHAARMEVAQADLDRQQEAYRQTLGQVRKARQVTQVQLADALGVTQSQVSRLEKRPDIFLSTLERYLAGIGASLEIHAVFPDGARVEIGMPELAGESAEELQPA